MPADSTRVVDLVSGAMERPAAERDEYVARRCAGDEDRKSVV